eukprot:CAMPEP_0175759358 /NCGR_PEP_ID=MMETSP0097-20121207/65522_1 /TAXON_ID=311494 /ORGANISM="Alexandrium monilatum, Strain CCMP3105" /LENGTH=69 /DNA_ID=CAMNT_0017068737 /DNA_START=61 /DNA_END=267 /DNA_ORIENTATION=-
MPSGHQDALGDARPPAAAAAAGLRDVRDVELRCARWLPVALLRLARVEVLSFRCACAARGRTEMSKRAA